MSIKDLANELKELDQSIALIYAFNATGKTRLSVAYKDATKDPDTGQHSGVYYNAFSEDLFVWDNDEDNDGADIKLNVLPSSLNQFHSFLTDNEDAVTAKLSPYNPRYQFRLNPYHDREKGIESVTFFNEGAEDTPIKISRGEERSFVWCFYLALLEVDGWADQQDAHIFIDDPISSLDDHNIFVTADTIFELVEQFYDKKRLIITTHHIGLFANLANRLTKGEKSGRYKNLTALRVLKRIGDDIVLESPKRSVFLYHLHLLELLEEARNSQLYTYHFSLLRQLLENVSSFLGTGRASYTLQKIGIENAEAVMNVVNTHSHKTVYYDQTEMMSEYEQTVFLEVFNKLTGKFEFHGCNA
jgi:wobble nucleotide-excising tRNase